MDQLRIAKAIHQLDCAVMTYAQALSQRTDTGLPGKCQAFDGEQSLMLLRRDSRSPCSLFTEFEEDAHGVPEFRELPVVVVFDATRLSSLFS